MSFEGSPRGARAARALLAVGLPTRRRRAGVAAAEAPSPTKTFTLAAGLEVPLAGQTPHLWQGACVCVCVCVSG